MASEGTLKRIARVLDEALTVRVDKRARIIVGVWTGDYAAADAMALLSGANAHKRRGDRMELRLLKEEHIGKLLTATLPYLVEKKDLAQLILD